MKNSKIFAIVLFIALFVGGISIYYFSTPSLEKMVGQMIMTGFHGDGTNETDENFIAIQEQIKSGQVGGVILFDVDLKKNQ